jgi:dipeptide/tripeptide permease
VIRRLAHLIWGAEVDRALRPVLLVTLMGSLAGSSAWNFMAIGEMLWVPVSQSAVAGLAPEDLRGAYMGAFGGTAAMGFALAPFMGFQVRSAAGDEAMWAAFAVVAVAAAVLGAYACKGVGRRRTGEVDSAVLET